MINFRYHIVSLMAVFIALSVGIAVGVSLSPSVDQSILNQATQDRQQVTELRTELDRVKALNTYRDEYDRRIGQQVTETTLSGVRVAVVAMPEAPTAVVQALTTAVTESGGTLVRDVRVNADVFDTGQADAINQAMEPFASDLNVEPTSTPAGKIGLALARSIADRGAVERDDQAVAIGDALTKGGWVTMSDDSTNQAQLVLVVTATGTTPRPLADLLTAHIQFDLGVKTRAAVVLAGPNSDDLEGTDVLAARNDASAVDVLSTVDVADLASGVTTTILAGKEQVNGIVGKHYGALAKADAPLPDLPVR